jgi:hypothetical protein
MAEAANHTYKERPLSQETYAESLAGWHRWGAKLLLDETVQTDAEVAWCPAEAEAFADHQTALQEMIATDPEFGKKIDFEAPPREYRMVNGSAVDSTGRALMDTLERGLTSSSIMAEHDPDMQDLAYRDEGDVLLLGKAEALLPGQSIFARSKSAVESLQSSYGDKYRSLGLREDLDIWHSYSKTEDGKLIARSYSVKTSNDDSWRKVLADAGATVPEGIVASDWIRHDFVRDMSPQNADVFMRQLRAKYYAKQGMTGARYSSTEYLQANNFLIKKLFNMYGRPLARGVASKKNSEELQSFADACLQAAPSKTKPETIKLLRQAANCETITDEMSRTLSKMLAYVVVEELRTGLQEYFTTGVPTVSKLAAVFSARQNESFTIPSTEVRAMLNQRLAGRFESGVRAARGYGGCSSADFAKTENDPMNPDFTGSEGLYNLSDPETAMGNLTMQRERKIGKVKFDKCVVKNCPTQPGKTEVGGCGVCLKHCQKKFDANPGWNPDSLPPREKESKQSESIKVTNTNKNTFTLPKTNTKLSRELGSAALWRPKTKQPATAV